VVHAPGFNRSIRRHQGIEASRQEEEGRKREKGEREGEEG